MTGGLLSFCVFFGTRQTRRETPRRQRNYGFGKFFGEIRGLTGGGRTRNHSPPVAGQRRSSQVVRQWFAKPSFVGSIPTSASSLKPFKTKGLGDQNHLKSGDPTFANFGQKFTTEFTVEAIKLLLVLARAPSISYAPIFWRELVA